MSGNSPRTGRDRGFALVLALWVCALIALLIAGIVLATRTQHGLMRHAGDTARAKAAAEGGFYYALHKALDRDARAPWLFDRVYPVRVWSRDVRVRIRNERGKLDLLTAEPALLMALLDQCGVTGGAAQALTDEIIAVRATPERLRSLGDLVRHTQLSPSDVLRLQSVLSVHAGQGEPQAPAAETVTRAYDVWEQTRIGAARSPRRARAPAAHPTTAHPITDRHDLLEITAMATGPAGVPYTLRAVVRLRAVGRPPFAVLSWQRAHDPARLSVTDGLGVTCPA